jgi:ElaB/YqjD/DUF883 family membrane-anchored ribosome-binding protein
MGQEPDRIRAEIEQTRAEMSDTVGALGYKADVKSRAKDRIVGVKDRIAGGTPDSDDVKDKARQARSVAQENPLGLAIGAVAVGFVAGMLIPSTRVEDEKLGSVADDVKEKVKETGQEAVERGKQVAQDAAQTVKESGQEQAQELKDSAQQNAQGVGGQPQYTAR